MKFARLIVLTLSCFICFNAAAQNAGIQIYQDMIKRNEADRQARLARDAAAAEAQKQCNYEAQQTAERLRQQAIRNSSLPESARCFEGSWIIKVSENNNDIYPMDITKDGKVYLNGELVNGMQGGTLYLANNTLNIKGPINGGGSLTQRLSLEDNRLNGVISAIQVKKGFF